MPNAQNQECSIHMMLWSGAQTDQHATAVATLSIVHKMAMTLGLVKING